MDVNSLLKALAFALAVVAVVAVILGFAAGKVL